MAVAPTEPKNAASILLGASIRAIRRDRKWLSLVTFADASQGHTGHIYRVTNWHYAGTKRATERWIDSEGRQVAKLSTRTRTDQEMESLGYRRAGASYKHRYIMHLREDEMSATPIPAGQENPEHNRIRSVQDGVLQRVSVSAIERFDPSQYGGCNRRWWFTVNGHKEPETKAKAGGTDIHAQIERYSNTGEDCLGPIVRAGKHFIPRIKDLGEGWAFNEYTFSGFTIAGVPFEGKIDLLNFSGYSFDNEGARIIEEPGTVEICDWKSTADIQAYAKAAGALIDTIQMPGYGFLASKVAEANGLEIRRVRLSHGYFQTKGPKHAEKRSMVFPLETVKSRMVQIENTVEKMKAVARMLSASDAEPNPAACTAYRGCPHAGYCPLSGAQVAASLIPLPTTKGTPPMSSLQAQAQSMMPQSQQAPAPAQGPRLTMPPPVASQYPQPGAQPPPHFAQSAPPQQYAQQAPAQPQSDQRAALLQEEAHARAAAVQYGPCNACGQPLTGVNTSVLPDQRTIVHVNCPARPAQIAPPDQPPVNPTTIAQPVPPEMMGQLPPQVQQAAQAHAAQVAAYQQQTAPQPQAPQTYAQPPAQGQPQSAPPAATEAPRGRGRPKGSGKKGNAQPPAQGQPQSATGWALYVDCEPVSGADCERFDPWLDDIHRALCDYHKVPDIRCAGDNKALGFGAWRGALAASIRMYAQPSASADPNFIPADSYVIHTRREMAAVAAETLAEIVRGAGGIVVYGSRV